MSQTSLRTLEFHRVSWGRDQVRDLLAVLDKQSNIKQVNFHRNNFDEQCLSDISELLKRNATIKELVFSESGIGYLGSSLIASALMINETLEELQIWDDSLGSKGAEELSKMIEVNSTLKLLIILDTSPITATPLISAVLARNRSMEVHVWCGEKREQSSSKVVEFVPGNNALRIYKLDDSGACRVACALGWNSMVKLLDFTGVKLKSRWAREFRAVLEQNRTLKQVKLTRTCLKDKGVVYVAAGLFKNLSLECLEVDGNWFTGVGVEHLLCPLSRFSALQNQANTSMRSLTFGGGKTKIGRVGLQAILKLLETNQSLTYLGIHDDESLRPYDFISIFRGMERNATLKWISLMGCRGVAGEKVLEAIMNTLQVNPWIEEIELERTPLQGEGRTEKIYLKLGQNGRADQIEADVLKDMPLTAPQSCRVFLCGQDFAGKVALNLYNNSRISKNHFTSQFFNNFLSLITYGCNSIISDYLVCFCIQSNFSFFSAHFED